MPTISEFFKKELNPYPILILVAVLTPFPVGECSNRHVFYKKRPAYVECPQELNQVAGVYPLADELCSVKYSLCAAGEVIRGVCPKGLYFNPAKLDCDDGSDVGKCKEDFKSRLKKGWDARPLENDPDYNDCTRRPCNFYPNAEDPGDGTTYVFCDAGVTRIRKCPLNYKYDWRAADCKPSKSVVNRWDPPKIAKGEKESENPLDDNADSEGLGAFNGKRPSSALGMEPENGVSVIQDPTPRKGHEPPADSVWSFWIFCPNATYITKMTSADCTCTLPNGAETEEENKGDSTKPKEEHLLTYPVSGVKLQHLNCKSKGGGAINALRKDRKGIEFLCSGDPGERTEAEFCPATTAACGMSLQYSEKTKKVSNVRLRCCPVRSPLFKPLEELVHVNSFDNSKGESWRKFEFETGVYGVSSPKKDMKLSAFYASLGFTFNMVFKDLEKGLRENTDCLKQEDCIYPWDKFQFTSKDVIKVTKRLMVPPKSRTKLFLVYAQAGYFRINTNRFVEYVENLEYYKQYEEIREVPDSEIVFPTSKPGKDDDDSDASKPLKAQNLNNKEDQPFKLCPFHNLPQSKRVLMEPPDALIISSPVVHDMGEWMPWQNCSEGTYFNRIRQLVDEVSSGGKSDKAGVVQLGLGCRKLKVSLVEGQKVGKEADTGSGSDVVEMDFVNKGFQIKPWQSDAWRGGTCQHGVHVGFQMKTGSKSANDMVGTEELRLICSCDKDDLENASPLGKPNEKNKGKSQKDSEDEDDDERGTALTPNKNSNKIMPKTNGWTEEQICEPFQALQALAPQEHPMKTGNKKYDNHGLTNVKMKCVDIPNPGDVCQAKEEKKVLVARCQNGDSMERDCVFPTNIGVGYREGPDVYALANGYESVGHTLGCIIPNLKKNFQNNLDNSPTYREPIWKPLVSVNGQLQTPPKSTTEIYQVVGECGPYKVSTNRFIKTTNGENEEPFDLPLPATDSKAPCWKDFIEMDPVPPPENPNGPDSICKFHEEFSMDSYENTTGGIILSSPPVTDFGAFDLQNGWKHCPEGTYIFGVSANQYQASAKDHAGIAHVGFRCVNPQDMQESGILSLKTPALPGGNQEALKKWFNCDDKGSAAYGFQLYVQPPQTEGRDNVATTNVLLICSCEEKAVVKFDHDEDGRDHLGLWTDDQICQPKQALCGFIGQFQTFEKPKADVFLDNTGLNNMKAKCCDVVHPASTCKPQTTRILVGHCDNRNDTRERLCKIELNSGVSYSPESAGTRRRNFYESTGFVAECAGKVLKKSFAVDSVCKAQREDCEMDWKDRPKQTWLYEDMFTDFIPVPGSVFTPVYQIQGRCGDFVVKTNRYVTEGRTREIPLTDDDIGAGPPCWEDDIPFKADERKKLKVEPSPINVLHDPEMPEYDFVKDGSILTSPVVDTVFPDETHDSEWKFCKPPTKDAVWYVDSVYVERQGSPKDLTGLVAISLFCRNPKLTGYGDHVISGTTPGAIVQEGAAKDWKKCECGTGTGFQISSVGAQQLEDDLAIESFKMMCSCGEPVVKNEDEFPKELGGQRGKWTRTQLCRPRQAICGIKTRSKPFKAVDNMLKWDNMGITQVNIKCCDVPNPAATCEPKNILQEIGICENNDDQRKRKCILESAVGVTYDYDDKERKNLANFYESIGWGLTCVIPELSKNFQQNVQLDGGDRYSYPWKNASEKIWHVATPIQQMIEIKDRKRAVVYQVVGQCGPYLVGTENFVREDTNMRNTENVMEDSYVHSKPIQHLPVPNCWASESPISSRDYIDPTREFNNNKYPFHGMPSPGKLLLSNLTEEGIEVEFPVAISPKNFGSRAREECFEGGYMVGYSYDKLKVENDDLGAVHFFAKCQNLSNVMQKRRSPWDDEGKKQKSDDDEDTDGKRMGSEELLLRHPLEKFDKKKLISMYQKCVLGVLVGFQVRMDPVSLKPNHGPAAKDDLGIDDIRMLCSIGKPLSPLEPPRGPWDLNDVESCRPYQALCAIGAKFGPQSVGSFEKTDGTGISQVQMACCDVPNPGIGNHPDQISRLASVCNNLQYDQDRECEHYLDVGVTYDHQEHPDESIMHLSVGYSIPCIVRDLKTSFQETEKVRCISSDCSFDWKSQIHSKIFQHGLTTFKNKTVVSPFTRQDIFQTMAQLNDLLVLSNEFELVVTGTDGKELNRNRFTIPLSQFPEMKEHLVCHHTDKARKRPKSSDEGDLVPENLMKPKQKGKGDITEPNIWPATEDIREIDGMYVLQTMRPNNLEGGDDDGESPKWDDWVNCPRDSFASYISPEAGNTLKGFGFKCVDPEDGGLHENLQVGGSSSFRGSKEPGWKSTYHSLSPVVISHDTESNDKLVTKRELASGEAQKSGQKIRVGTGTAMPNDVGCDCKGMSLSVVIGVEVKSSEKSGVFGSLTPFCPCHKNIPANATVSEGNAKEPLVCRDRQAICGFQVKRKNEEIVALRAACCDVPSPLHDCSPRDKLFRVVVCDNSFVDVERKCNFNLDVGLTYDFDNFNEQIRFYEALNWNLECMSQSLADKFSIGLGPGPDTSKNWMKGAKKSPLGPEWDIHADGTFEFPIKPYTKLEVFQVVGHCDLYKTYVDRFLMTEFNTVSGVIVNIPKDLDGGGQPQLTGKLKGSPTKCWMDNYPLIGNNILKNRMKPPFGEDGYHGYPPSKKGKKLYDLKDHSTRTGLRLRSKQPTKSSEEDYGDEEDLVGLILCDEETYIRRFTGESNNNTHFLCATANLTTPNEKSFSKSGVPKEHKYNQISPAAFVGVVDEDSNNDKDSKDTDLFLVPSLPLESRGGKWGDGKHAEYCHPGQAICGVQGGEKRGIICCTVENPAEICEPRESRVMSATCDNRKDSRLRKCTVDILVGTTYNYDEHPRSSYFYTSIGYVPECLKSLKKKFQGMPCITKGNCEYNWGSAPAKIWDKMQAIPQDFEVPPHTKVEYHQKIGICSFAQGEVIIPTPVLQRKIINAAGVEVKSSEFIVTGGVFDTAVTECKLNFMDLSEKPALPPRVNYPPIKLRSLVPVDKEAMPKCSFHGLPQSTSFEHFNKDTEMTDQAISLVGIHDLDLDLNLKPKWESWKECKDNGYVKDMEANVSTLSKESKKVDAMGLHQMIFGCVSNKDKPIKGALELLAKTGTEKPTGRMRASCQDGAVSIGFEIQQREYQGSLGDDNAYVNFKQLCSCGKHELNEFTGLSNRDHQTGDWDAAQVCKPRQAICGYTFQHSNFEDVGTGKTFDTFLLYDNLGITGLHAKCCHVPSPISDCIPEEEMALVAVCDNLDIRRGNRRCDIEVDVGLSYIFQKDAVNMSDFYESVGWNLECLKDEISERFIKAIGDSKVMKDFSWKNTKGSPVWNKAVQGQYSIPLVEKSKHFVYQVIGKCGIYRVHTNIFFSNDTRKDASGSMETTTIGNTAPDPCWAELSPLMARNWLVFQRDYVKPNFEIYVKVKKGKVLPWMAEDSSKRKGCQIQSPQPALPAYIWNDSHLCPENSYIRSFSVKRAMNTKAEYMQSKVDVYGVVSVAYHCMYPDMQIAEEKVYVWRPFAKIMEKIIKDNKVTEKHDSPGGRYQYCLGAAMGVAIESVPASKVLIDNYGILDLRLMCKTLGKDSDFAHKLDLAGTEMNAPAIHENIVCKAKQALCSFQGAFTKTIEKDKDSAAMTNIKVACCNVPSPLKKGKPSIEYVLAATCDNLLFNRKRKCRYTLGVGIQYDIRNQKESSYFYLSVGYTPTCISEDIKEKFPELLNSPPQVFQEVSEMKLTIDMAPKTKTDIYQLVGRINEIMVQTTTVRKVTINQKLAEVERIDSTEKKNLLKLTNKPCEVDGLDMDPSMIDMGKPERIRNLEEPASDEEQCVFMEPSRYTSVHMLKSDLTNYIEGDRELNLERNHITTWKDYSWANCNEEAVVMGFNFVTGNYQVPDGRRENGTMDTDMYGIGGIAMQCDGILSVEMSVVHQAHKGSNLSRSDFEKGKRLIDGTYCQDGVAVGFAQQVQPFKKSLDDEGMIGFELYCSCGEGDQHAADDKEKKKRGKNRHGMKNKKKDKWKEQREKDSRWTEPKYCRPREAICGFTVMAQAKGAESIRKYDNVAVTNIRAKCCPVDSPAFQCTPSEKFALVGVCNNTEGLGMKVCNIHLYVGLAYDRKPENDRILKIYEGLGWALACVYSDLSENFAHSIKSKMQFNWTEAMGKKQWNQVQKKTHPITADPGTITSLYQVIGTCGFYKVYTGKYVVKQVDLSGIISSENKYDLDEEIGAEDWDPLCWEDALPIRGRDFMSTIISKPITCPVRTKHKSAKHEKLVLSKEETQKMKHDSILPRSGYVISTPHPELRYRNWSEWQFCPEGTYVRGWASVAAGMAHKKEYDKSEKKQDYSGVVFVKAICQSPDVNKADDHTLSHLQPENEWDEGNWTLHGKYGHLYCVGAGVGIQGIIRTKMQSGQESKSEKSKIAPDVFYFHDTKLLCSCGADAGFMREGSTAVDSNQKKRDQMAEEKPVEACKPRHAVCGVKVSWGKINLGDSSLQDGFGISNMQALCCEVPSPLADCKNPVEKLIFAMACDNSRGSVPRRCMYNLAVGIAYDYDEHELESFFYDSNGFSPACIATEVSKKFKNRKPKRCLEKGCKYRWNDAPIQVWQESTTVAHSQEVEPKQRFRIYQVVGQCKSIMVLTDKFVKVLADPKGEELSREVWHMTKLPPERSKKCDM